ncbi:hypothetical protein PQU92_13910 [Asticcacaulis sp. BYS171W]|uniref:Uncharacterized protein n=1 Tax=Asticcacaulis aquaticus TaxID=2984212 RepID=A0ABT5HWB0_9CAUL|nr:hypothetical protein [Asticcacaulis aquaticus]MDC7684377.1 hypothetical protein [Asticcacaulis aquaticus]
MTFPSSFEPFDDVGPDDGEWELILESARAQDRLDEQAEDYRLELAEYFGIAEADQRLGAD